MPKKIYSLLTIILFAACSTPSQQKHEIFKAIPQNTTLVIQVNDTLATDGSELLSKIFELNSTLKKTIKNITPRNPSLPFIFCLTPVGKNHNAISFISKSVPSDTLLTYKKEIVYGGKKIRTFEKGGQIFYDSKIGNLKMISESQLINENGIRNYKRKSSGITNLDFFQLVESVDKNLPINFIIHPLSKPIINSFFPNPPLFPPTGKQWIALDLDVNGNYFSLDGIAFLNDSIPDKLSIIKSLDPNETKLHDLVPKNFTSYLSLSVNDNQKLEENFKEFSRGANIPLRKIDFSTLSSVTEIGWVSSDTEKYVIFNLDSKEDIPSFINLNEEKKIFRGITYQRNTIPNDIISMLSTFGQPMNVLWSSLYENYLIFSETERGIKSLLSNYLDQNTLGKDPNFKALKNRLADENSFVWLGQSKNLVDYWEENGKKIKLLKGLPTNEFPLIAFQGVGDQGITHLHLSLQKKQPIKDQNGIQNNLVINLPKPTIIEPQWLKNHRNNSMDVLIQDADNILYLFSNNGKLYWKKKLESKIIGTVHQVDLFKNKRLQMAFRTRDKLIILDREGNFVQPFNIKLPWSENPLPLSVFDYDSNKNYRFLIAQDKSLLMFNEKGRRVDGFNLKKVKNNILFSPKHIRFQGRDYIVLQLENNTLKIVSRQGKDRIKVKGNINFSNNKVFSYLNTFATTDKEGNLIQVDIKGNKVSSALGLNPKHQIAATTKSLVTLSGNTLNIKGIPVSLPYGDYTPPKIFYLKNTLYVSTADKESQKVYLFYSNGKKVKGFPVYGNNSGDLSNSDKDKAVELLVSTKENSFFIYKIN